MTKKNLTQEVTGTMTKQEIKHCIELALQGLEEQRNRTFALVAAVRNKLTDEDLMFNEIQLLDMAEELLGDVREVQSLKKCLEIE